MNKKKYVIPRCPNCGYKLETVWENEYNTYAFDHETGRYKEDWDRGEIEIRCPECETEIGDVFEEGACNYQAKEVMPNEKKYKEND